MYFIGDIHGNFNGLIERVKQFEINNENLIQVGDFGIGFRSVNDDLNFMNKLNDYLSLTGNNLFVIRGNHDDPKYFDGSIQLSNLCLLPDYSILTLEGKTLLLIGGAISIDRRIRRVDLNYWKDEIFVFDEQKLNSILATYNTIDILVTHSAPLFAFPQVLDSIVISYSKKDQTLIQELANERKLLSDLHSSIVKVTKPKYWYYGHFHVSNAEVIENTKFCLLDSDEIVELRF